MKYKTHYCIQANENVGKKIKVAGWVEEVRDLGKLVFVLLKDSTARLQITSKKDSKTFEILKKIGLGYVISVEGTVMRRPKNMINPKMKTGKVELLAEKVEILNEAKRLPLIPDKPGINVTETTRLKYRYLDLRSDFMQRNLRLRAEIINALREFYLKNGFVEIETPYLAKSTPEGSRDFLVPSRLHPGKFYALAQSPQLYKQMLMVAGFEKYFQFPRCFRDEDLRGDRQPEFTQLDVEISFVDMNDVIEIVEESVRYMVKKVFGKKLGKFERISYREAIEKFGTDKPDLRIKGMKIESKNGKVFVRVEKEYIEKLKEAISLEELQGKIKSIEDNHKVRINFKTFEDLENVEIEGKKLECLSAADELRRFIAYKTNSVDPSDYKFAWIINIPLFELDEEGNIKAAHHPFTAPMDEDLELLEKEPLRVRAKAYDLVLNGWEIAGGSIRNHKPEIQKKIFKVLGLSETEYKERYGFMLEAFEYGTPPHGGIAFGLDRLVAVLLGLNIKDVIAFPKTKDGKELMTGTPSKAPEEYLKDLKWLKIDLK